jgi:hypothetical protein
VKTYLVREVIVKVENRQFSSILDVPTIDGYFLLNVREFIEDKGICFTLGVISSLVLIPKSQHKHVLFRDTILIFTINENISDFSLGVLYDGAVTNFDGNFIFAFDIFMIHPYLLSPDFELPLFIISVFHLKALIPIKGIFTCKSDLFDMLN